MELFKQWKRGLPCFLIVVAIFWGRDVWSQERVHFTTEQGLSQGFVTCLAQDKTGYIWVGTLNGLNRFDGYNFKVYKREEQNASSLYSDAIQFLTVDEQGVLWVLSSMGVQVYDEKGDEFIGFKELESFNGHKIGSILVENNQLVFVTDNKVWYYGVNYEKNGLISLNFIACVPFDIQKKGAIYSMFLRNGVVWLGTDRGIYALNFSGDTEQIYPEIKEAVFGIWQDKIHEQLLIQTLKGIYVVEKVGPVTLFEGVNANYGSNLLGKKVGEHYLVFTGNAIQRWTGTQLEKTGLQFDVNITSALVDRKENIWIGLDAMGLVCIQNKKRVINQVIAPGKPAFNRVVMDHKDQFWLFSKTKKSEFAAADLGFYVNYSKNNRQVEPTGEQIFGYYMDIDEKGVKWLVDYQQQLIKINPNGQKEKVKLENIAYLNTLFGVNCLSNQVLFLLSNDCREACFVSSDGTVLPVKGIGNLLGNNLEGFSAVTKPSNISPWMWMASSDGIFGVKADFTTKQVAFKQLNSSRFPNTSQLHNRIIFAQADNYHREIVWIGTWSGLLKWNLEKDDVEVVVSKNGPIKSPVFTMAQSAGNIIWLGTNDGLLRLNTVSGESRLFTTVDGLPGTEFNRNTTTITNDGTIIMGTVNGYIAFYPDDLSGRMAPEQMVISGVLQGSTALPMIKIDGHAAIEDLTYKSSNILVQFSMLDYSNMQVPQYRFRYGSSGEWFYNGLKNTVSLIGLLPGKYIFEVQGSLDGSLWSESAFLKFTVQKPWWGTWWAIGLLLTVCMVVTWFIFKNKRQLLQQKYQNDLLRREAQHESEIIAAKERILTNIAHDLRTPITLITGMAERLTNQGQDKVERSVETIRRQSGELLSMINQILELGRIREFGTIPLNSKVINLDQFLRSLLDSYSYSAELKTIQLRYQQEGNIPLVFLDEQCLRAIIGNLLSNALKMTPTKGSVTLKVEVLTERLIISVLDTGPGVSPEEVKHIFTRYYQSDAQSKVGGVGVGLAYASEMADLLGGTLSCENTEPGNEPSGAVFSIEFLLKRIMYDPEKHPAFLGRSTDQEPAVALNPDRHVPTILLVEDGEEMASFIRELLEPQFEVLSAVNGKQGLTMALDFIPDLVLTDVMMPEMSGLELCRALKDDIRTSHIPVLLLTAKTGEEALKEGLACGASVYLTKPFDSATLLQYINNSLRLQEQTKRYFERMWGSEEEKDRTVSQEIPMTTEVVRNEGSFIAKLNAILELKYTSEQYSVEDLASDLHLTPKQLRRKVTALGGGSVVHLIRKYRLEKSKVLLLSNREQSVSEVAFNCGFSDPNYFSSVFSKEYGISPTNFRKMA